MLRRTFLRAALAATVFIPVLAAGLRADDAKVSGDLKKMQGTWVRDGDEGPDARWVITGDQLKATVNGVEYSCTITLDPKAEPHPSADFAVKQGPDDVVGKTSKAIYKFDGDKLVFCVTHPGVEKRPAEFKPDEEQAFLFKFKKEQ